MIKQLWKRITCRHDFWWCAETTWSNSAECLDHVLKEIDCKCKKCGKRKSIKFKEPVDIASKM